MPDLGMVLAVLPDMPSQSRYADHTFVSTQRTKLASLSLSCVPAYPFPSTDIS